MRHEWSANDHAWAILGSTTEVIIGIVVACHLVAAAAHRGHRLAMVLLLHALCTARFGNCRKLYSHIFGVPIVLPIVLYSLCVEEANSVANSATSCTREVLGQSLRRF